MTACPFCLLDRPFLAESPLVVAFADARPVSPGHTLVVPRRHAPTYFDCTQDEKAALWALVERVRGLLSDRTPTATTWASTPEQQPVRPCSMHTFT